MRSYSDIYEFVAGGKFIGAVQVAAMIWAQKTLDDKSAHPRLHEVAKAILARDPKQIKSIVEFAQTHQYVYTDLEPENYSNSIYNEILTDWASTKFLSRPMLINERDVQ